MITMMNDEDFNRQHTKEIAMGCRGQGLITWHKHSLSTHDSARCRRAKVQFQRQIQFFLLVLTIIIRLIIKYNSFFIITKIHKDMKKFDSRTNINNNVAKSKFNLINFNYYKLQEQLQAKYLIVLLHCFEQNSKTIIKPLLKANIQCKRRPGN